MGLFNKVLFSCCLLACAFVTPAKGEKLSLDECKVRASSGDADAAWQLGQRYESGDGVRKDHLRAVAQYRKAAAKNHAKACARLAEFYETGKAVGKDAVLAAKYKAIARGESPELASAVAKTAEERAKVDEIEVALDYIIGRNGKQRDAKAGIRLLYQTAKDKSVAQRVFVERWSKGDLDDALEVLSDDEWEKILPWYKNAWDSGNKRAGLVLGNDAYSRKQYSAALNYWKGSGLAKCWYFVGRFYAPCSDEGKGGGPSDMRDETKARKAYEKCLKIDGSRDDAKFELGCLYLLAKNSGNANLKEAKRIFSYFIEKNSNDKWYNFLYGLAGYSLERLQFETRWPKRTVDTLLMWAKQYGNVAYYNLPASERNVMRDYLKMLGERKAMETNQNKFVSYIRRAANFGCEPAQKFMSNYDGSH